jgi:dipeptidyl aminopeptidase/acylaminoacyl peptidase
MTAVRFTLIVAIACGPRPVAAPKAPERIAIIAAERGAQGARLVVLDERGDRQFELVRAADSLVRDTHPVVSPDGRWLVFASSRGRPLAETSLWIAPLAADAEPVRLTSGRAIDSHPVWTRDGRAIVFASTREGGDFDLFRLAIDRGRARGEPEELTRAAGHEVTPTVAADGTVIYAAITRLANGQLESHLERRERDGTIKQITDGPADTSPALSPDDRTIVFARPKEHNGALDAELWTMPVNLEARSESAPLHSGGTLASQLVDVPLTDESGPVWSPDGRFVFATSVLRGASGNPVFSSVIVIDTRARPIVARLLQDRVGAIARLTPAITPVTLDAAALAADPEYLPELARIMAAAMAAQQLEQNP